MNHSNLGLDQLRGSGWKKFKSKLGLKVKLTGPQGQICKSGMLRCFLGSLGMALGCNKEFQVGFSVGKEERESPGVSFSCQEFSPAWIQLLDVWKGSEQSGNNRE